MQIFTKKQHKKFIEYFKVKEKPTQVELEFYEKTEKYIRYVKWIPGLRMIWIWNSISMNCSSKNSDIDLFIVTTNESMWLNRIIITVIFQVLWVRKTTKKHAWRFCLSFFSTLDWLDFNYWKIEGDIYLYFWILYFKPILDFNNTYSLFLKKNEVWANFSEYTYIIKDNINYIRYKKNIKNKKDFFILKTLNKLLKSIFIWKTIKSYEKLLKPYWIVITSSMLKFHDNDIRIKVKEDLKNT